MMWENSEVMIDLAENHYHVYAPVNQVQISYAQCCRVQCYNFGVRNKFFLKRLVCALAMLCILDVRKAVEREREISMGLWCD